MPPSPDDRFSLLVSRGSARGWVPEDLDDDAADEDLDQPRNRPVPGRWAVWGILALTIAGIVAFVLFAPSRQAVEVPTADSTAPSAANSQPQASGDASAEVTVHVVGEVNRPSVVQLPTGSRVSDAVSAAGGPTSDADVGGINLARVLVDGEQVVVPTRAVPPEPGSSAPNPADGGPGQAGSGTAGGGAAGAPGQGRPAVPADKININTADAVGLEILPGVGPATANAIIEHRTNNGPFTSVEQLLDVPGIGEATLDRLRDLVTV